MGKFGVPGGRWCALMIYRQTGGALSVIHTRLCALLNTNSTSPSLVKPHLAILMWIAECQCLKNRASHSCSCRYLKEFRVDQCPLFLQHKCQQHRPFTCFNWHFQVRLHPLEEPNATSWSYFQNQKRRRPVRRRDQTFNYSADIYCEKYDETTGLCPVGDE